MVKKIAEMAAAAAITDTSTSQISEVQGKQWMDSVVRFGEALRRMDQAVDMRMDLLGKGDKTLTVPKRTSVLDIDVSPSGGEGDVRDNTEMTNFDTVDITFSASDFKAGKISIAKQLAMTSRVDLIQSAREDIANAIADDLDTDIATTFQDTSVTKVVYGGDATGVDSLATGDTMTPDLLVDASTEIDTDNFEPVWAFIHPKQQGVLKKDSQFTNAAEYGDQSVVLRGEIGEYQGLSIIKTTNAPGYALNATDTNETPTTWGAAGHVVPVIGTDRSGRKVAATYAWKELPHIDYKYEPDERVHKVFYDQSFKGAVIQPAAIALIKVTDA